MNLVIRFYKEATDEIMIGTKTTDGKLSPLRWCEAIVLFVFGCLLVLQNFEKFFQ